MPRLAVLLLLLVLALKVQAAPEPGSADAGCAHCCVVSASDGPPSEGTPGKPACGWSAGVVRGLSILYEEGVIAPAPLEAALGPPLYLRFGRLLL